MSTTIPSPEEEAKAFSILKKSPEQRTDNDVELLFNWIDTLKCSFFEDNTDARNKDLCRCMHYEKLEPNTTLFKQGDESDKLYVIIRGSVGIWVTTYRDAHEYPKPQGLNQLRQFHQNAADGKIITPSVSRLHVERRSGKRSKAKPTKLSILGDDESKDKPKGVEIFVGFLRGGGPTTSFGEMGLLAGKERSATVRCTDDKPTEVLTIHKSDFDAVLKEHYSEMIEAKVEAMNTFPLFRNISDEHLQYISLHMKRQQFPANHLILKQGTQASDVFFIISGTVRSERIIMDESPSPRGSGRHSLRFSQQPQYQTMAEYSAGETLGAREALESESAKKYTYSMRTATDCDVFVVARDDLLSRLQKSVLEKFFADRESKSPAHGSVPIHIGQEQQEK